MATINVKNLLESYKLTINLPPISKLPLNVKTCLSDVLGIVNPSLPIGCSTGLSTSTDIDYITNCLSAYGNFTENQIQSFIMCLNTCYEGATVYPLSKGPIKWFDCCGNEFTDIVITNIPYTITGCVKNNTVIPIVDSSGQVTSLSAVTYGEVNCDCPPPTPTPTPTVTPSFGYTPSPTPTPTITPTLTATPTLTPTKTPTPTPTKTTINPYKPPIEPPTPTPTPTLSSSAVPTPTPTITPSVTPGITTIACGTDMSNTTAQLVPGPYSRTYKVNLGSGIGRTTLFQDLVACADRTIVEWNNQVVIDTGCQGNCNAGCPSSPECSDLEVLPWNTQFTTNCNLRSTFYKSAATPTYAYVTIKTPPPHPDCFYSIYTVRLDCPKPNTTETIGPNSLIRLQTSQQLSCLTGNTLNPITITAGDTITILPNWGMVPSPSSNYYLMEHNVWVEGGQYVQNPSGIPPIGNPTTTTTPPVWQLQPQPAVGITNIKMTINDTPNGAYSSGIPYTYTCGPNIGQTVYIQPETIHQLKPFSFKFDAPGVFDITVQVSGQVSDPKCYWYKFKNWITVNP